MRAPAMNNHAARLYVGFSLAAYMAVNLVLLCFHEPWCDEAQAWLIARELSPVGIIKQMAYEGHPAMWHFLLLPFAKSAMPYWSMNVLSLLIMGVAAGIFIIGAPFYKLTKSCIVFSPLFVYFFPVIARSYCLVAFAVVMLAFLYKNRNKVPYWYCLLIALLVQTHIIMLAMAGFLSIFFLVERWKEGRQNKNVIKSLFPLLLPLASFIILLIQISGTGKSSAMPKSIDFRNFLLLGGFLPRLMERLGLVACLLLGLLLAGIFFLFIYVAIQAKIGKELCVFVVSLLFQVFIYTCVYGVNLQRAFCGLYIVLWFVWVCYEPMYEYMAGSKNLPYGLPVFNYMLAGIAILMILLYGERIFADVGGSYSYAEDMAKAIEEFVPPGTDIVTSENGRTASVIPYLENYRFYSYQTGDYTTYAIWDSRLTQEYTAEEMIGAVRAKEKGDGFYLLVPPSSCISDLEDAVSGWELLYKTPEDCIQDEYYSLYYISFAGEK